MIRKATDFRVVLEEDGKRKMNLIDFTLLSVSYGLACLLFDLAESNGD